MIKPDFTTQKRRAATYQAVFSTESGRKVLRDLVRRHFNGAPIGPDEMTTLLLVGAQGVIWDILQALQVNPIELEATYDSGD